MIMSKRKYIYENFIKKAKQIHGNKYNYDEVEIKYNENIEQILQVNCQAIDTK